MYSNNLFKNIVGIIMPLVLIISAIILIVVLTLVIIEKSNKIKENFKPEGFIVSSCTIDQNKSLDNAIILNCKFAN